MHYRKSAEILDKSKEWKFLSSNFLAWAFLESAEHQSRKEMSEKALESFKKANKLFRESKNSLQIFVGHQNIREETHVINKLIEVSDLRIAYCFGRIAIEEARIFEKQGKTVAGAEKYGFAADTFQRIYKTGSSQIKKELQPIIYLCKAWQKMRIAEIKISPTMYSEAADLFKKACEYAIDQSMSLLALAHSNFCKALEAGTEFEMSRDIKKYSDAKKYLEIAASNYLKTGFRHAAEYANGTQRLFDAYMYLENAKIELDPERKTKFYNIAEKVLQFSASAFAKAEQPEKIKQVNQVLEKIKEEKELAIMLTEILQAPSIISSTESFVTPTPHEENAVGLENFEGAKIQANISQIQQAKIGEDFNLDIKIVNVGKKAIQLSFDPKAYPETPQQVELLQTQMSFVFLTDDYVYKIKKPVNLGYLDYTTLDKRLFFCQQEVELNRRLCPSAYLGVKNITQDNGDFVIDGRGEVVEHAVKMRRLPREAMMDVLLMQNQVSVEMAARLAQKLAEFHRKAETRAAISAFGHLDAITRNTDENFAQTEKYIGNTISREAYQHIEDYTDSFVQKNVPLFDKRIREGRIRDCHGDLHAAHICFTDDICIYDCIEFNDRFRYCDVASELAFLAMDLDNYGQAGLSHSFVSAYVEHSQDKEIKGLLRFYKCYRAYVRGKVESFKLDDPHISEEEKTRVLAVAQSYFGLAESYIY